jgi:hypothetical protein
VGILLEREGVDMDAQVVAGSVRVLAAVRVQDYNIHTALVVEVEEVFRNGHVLLFVLGLNPSPFVLIVYEPLPLLTYPLLLVSKDFFIYIF